MNCFKEYVYFHEVNNIPIPYLSGQGWLFIYLLNVVISRTAHSLFKVITDLRCVLHKY